MRHAPRDSLVWTRQMRLRRAERRGPSEPRQPASSSGADHSKLARVEVLCPPVESATSRAQTNWGGQRQTPGDPDARPMVSAASRQRTALSMGREAIGQPAGGGPTRGSGVERADRGRRGPFGVPLMDRLRDAKRTTGHAELQAPPSHTLRPVSGVNWQGWNPFVGAVGRPMHEVRSRTARRYFNLRRARSDLRQPGQRVQRF